jgi:hypothetical protein
MNGTKDFGAYGHATQALAHTVQIEAQSRHGAPRRRRRGLRYRIGKTLVLTGSRVMGRSVDVRDLVQPA